MDFKIETGIPLAKEKKEKKVGRPATNFPLAEMQTGESFLLPGAEKKAIQNWRMKLMNWRKRTNFSGEFKTRVVPEGLRVWRM